MTNDPTSPVTPARKKRAPIVAHRTAWFTARLYACGHEVTTPDTAGQPADACPKCGAEKNARYADSRHRRSLPIEPA